MGLTFSPLGPVEDLRMITAFDASFCSRPDGTSQGGYFLLLAPKHVLETHEDVYRILDWKSFKLPRVARSSLSAEAHQQDVQLMRQSLPVATMNIFFNQMFPPGDPDQSEVKLGTNDGDRCESPV